MLDDPRRNRIPINLWLDSLTSCKGGTIRSTHTIPDIARLGPISARQRFGELLLSRLTMGCASRGTQCKQNSRGERLSYT